MMILGMSLRIENKRTLVKWSIWAGIALLFLLVFLRVVIFESQYYSSKEGSERAVTETLTGVDVPEAEELIEEEPTVTEVKEYTVAQDRPRYLTINKLGINKARILAMDVTKDGELDTPRNVYDVGWFVRSGKPGAGGTMIIDGHNGGPNVAGVFKRLPALSVGDIIEVERGDGVTYRYKVVENKTIPLAEADTYMSVAAQSPEPGKESVTLITCTGEWSQKRQTYLSRQFTRAVLADE